MSVLEPRSYGNLASIGNGVMKMERLRTPGLRQAAIGLSLLSLCLSSGLGSAAHAGCKDKVGGLFKGAASWYGEKFHGRRTASGQIYDQNKFTCAHRTLPFGTSILVVNPYNGEECTVVVNDRGPHCKSRVIDLSKAAAKKLGIVGVGKVVCKTGAFATQAVKGTVKTTVTTVADAVTPGESKSVKTAQAVAAKAQVETAEVPAAAAAKAQVETAKAQSETAKASVETTKVPVETAKVSVENSKVPASL